MIYDSQKVTLTAATEQQLIFIYFSSFMDNSL